MVLSSVQLHSADRRGLAEPRRFTGDENPMRCAEHYCNQKHSITEERLGHPWQQRRSFPQQRCRQTHRQHKLLQVVPPSRLSRCGESTLPLPPDPLSPHPLTDAGAFQTTTSTPCHTQKTLFSNKLNGYSLENKENRTLAYLQHTTKSIHQWTVLRAGEEI